MAEQLFCDRSVFLTSHLDASRNLQGCNQHLPVVLCPPRVSSFVVYNASRPMLHTNPRIPELKLRNRYQP